MPMQVLSSVISGRSPRMIAERAYSEQNELREFRERSGKKTTGAYLRRKSVVRYALFPVPPLV